MTQATNRPSRFRRASVAVLVAVFLPLVVAGPAPAGPDPAPPPDLAGPPDYLIPPVEPAGDPLVPGAPSATQTSEYMAGTVVYSVLFVESSGGSGNCSPADPQTENWSAPRQAQVLSELSAGLAFWPARTNRPALDFVLDNLGTAPTSCEPINRLFHTFLERGKWIADVLTAEGFPATPQTHVSVARSLVDSRRTALGADWGFLILVVDSLNDPDGLSPDGWRGAADLNGPMQYLSWDNGGWGIDRMNLVALHETGHTFGALDEYNGGCSTADTWGYLNVANASCNNGGITSDISVMGEGSELEHPAADVSVSARAAIGWRNPSGPSGQIVDVVRTSTASITPFAPDPTSDETPTYAASAGNQAFPPGGCNTLNGVCWRMPAPATISKVSGAEWSLDSGAWTSAGVVPSDGAFDEEAGEGYTFTPTSPVPVGAHTFATRAVNEFGHVSPVASDSLTISLPPGVVSLTVSKSGNGGGTITGTGINCGSDCTENYASGTPVVLTATPLYASTFSGWSNCDSPSGSTCTMTMSTSKTVSANFTTTPTFADVPPTNPHYPDIEHLYDLGVTQGCSQSNGQLFFCPTQNVPREQMAAFLVRAKGLTQLFPATPTFADVAPGSTFYGYIERLYEQGITQGCGQNGSGQLLFCPSQPVPREQMAAFLVRAKGLTQLFPPTPTFADVPASSVFFGYVERLVEQGITQGCGVNGSGQPLFCPSGLVSRQQMASFLIRAFAS
jgi:hypothetical protein